MAGHAYSPQRLFKNFYAGHNDDGNELLATCGERIAECGSPSRMDADGQCGFGWNHGGCGACIEGESDEPASSRAMEPDEHNQEPCF